MTETSEIWTGKASSYDRVRPTSPPVLLDLLTQLIHMPHPSWWWIWAAVPDCPPRSGVSGPSG